MNKEVKSLWVNALRSGEYIQGHTSLRTNDGHFCCLGVLCDLYMIETGIGQWRERRFYIKGDESIAALLMDVAIWAGIPTEGKETNPKLGERDAIGLNDHEGYTFEQIADEIDKYL